MKKKDVNQAAYRRLRPAIDKKYRAGRFIAIAGGKVVADAKTFDALTAKLRKIGEDNVDTLVVQARADYPDKVTLFTPMYQEFLRHVSPTGTTRSRS